MKTEPRQELEALFAEAGSAHHRAFAATNGEDAEWPRWYADYLIERVNGLLRTNLTAEEFARLLTGTEDKRKAEGIGSWPKFYADTFLRLYAPWLAR